MPLKPAELMLKNWVDGHKTKKKKGKSPWTARAKHLRRVMCVTYMRDYEPEIYEAFRVAAYQHFDQQVPKLSKRNSGHEHLQIHAKQVHAIVAKLRKKT
jgi:hypothetical protein